MNCANMQRDMRNNETVRITSRPTLQSTLAEHVERDLLHRPHRGRSWLLLPLVVASASLVAYFLSPNGTIEVRSLWFPIIALLLASAAVTFNHIPGYWLYRSALVSFGIALVGIPAIGFWYRVGPADNTAYFAGVGLVVLWVHNLPQLGYRTAALIGFGFSLVALVPLSTGLPDSGSTTAPALLIGANLLGISCSLNTRIHRTRLLAIIHSLYEKATTDKVSGTWNRHHFVELAERECARARRLNKPLAALLIDIDHFKRINDLHGHLLGDRALVLLGRCLKADLREFDICGRYGGDEFAILLTESSTDTAMATAQRILAHVNAVELLDGEDRVPLSISIGVAGAAGEDCCLDTLIGKADEALYRAKILGRNRVYAAQNGE